MMLYLATVAVLMTNALALTFLSTTTEHWWNHTEPFQSTPMFLPGNTPEPIPVAQPPCHEEWTEFSNQGVCVRAINDLKLTFDHARFYCQAIGGDLVTVVKSKQDKDFVNALLSKGVFYWIGLWDPQQDRRFQFVDGVELHWGTWNAFMKGEPNNLNRNEYCVEMKNGKWFDKRCERKRNFVCQHVAQK